MAASVLHHITLGTQWLWNAQRQVAGVWLTLAPHPGVTVQATHVVSALATLWASGAPRLTLSTPDPALLAGLLQATPPGLAQVAPDAGDLRDPTLAQHVRQAHQRGLPLVWRGAPSQRPLPAWANVFERTVISLTPEESLAALQAARRTTSQRARGVTSGAANTAAPRSPVQRHHTVEAVASQALAVHCLDNVGTPALLGWPHDDVLYSLRQTRLHPSHSVVQALIDAIDSDAPMDEIEHRLGQDPLLAYRFLVLTNSAGLSLRQDIHALRQGLMVLGLSRTRAWLAEQLPSASRDPNLDPVRLTQVLRARLMAQLLDTGESEALKREIHLCGLFSQLDSWLTQPLATALRPLPLPSRVKDAVLGQTGPYWPALDLATTLELGHLPSIRTCVASHGFDPEDVNLAVLRTASSVRGPMHSTSPQRHMACA